jgi:N,N'-diacetyllegionaminate synthase
VVTSVDIAGRAVGPGQPCYVVAEAGVNHNGDAELAVRLVDAAADAGADAIKFQTFSADRLVAADAPKAPYQERAVGDESQRDMLARLELTRADHERLVARCAERGIAFLSSPFDEGSIDLLDELDVAAIKIASPDVVNLPLLEHAAATGRPLLVSTGMATLDEVRAAMGTIAASPVVLLHCVSAYPAEVEDANLRAIDTLAGEFGVPVGYSDHALGTTVALAAVARGACVLEKHLTLDRSLPGPDHAASLEPAELRELVAAVREIETALGDGVKRAMPSEQPNIVAVRRSVAAACEVAPGTVLERSMLTTLRPATGIAPGRLGELIGRRTRRALHAGELLSESDLE